MNALYCQIGTLIGVVFLSSYPVQAQQITPQVTIDGTLNTIVTRAGNDFVITDGTAVGSNLFHSFREFSLPTNGFATFNVINTPDISTIFGRVTGGNLSNIDGTIRTLNQTSPISIFLLNPSGILFGPNARLNIGGSFVATTADSIRFNEGVTFSAANPTAPPLLTISVPVGLQFGANPGGITHQSTNFAVQSGQRLALVGGDIAIPGGRLTAPSGPLDLASIGANGSVNISPAGAFSYPANQAMGNIQLSNAAIVNTSSDRGGGAIQVFGRQISLGEAASISSNNNAGNNPGTVAGGGIRINATERLDLDGTAPDESAATNITARVRGGSGTGSSIDIVAPQVSITGGAQIVSRTDAVGQAGNITIQANQIEAIGESGPDGDFPSGIISRTEATATGRGGDVTLTASTVKILEGAELRASSRGNGNAGNFTVRSNELITNSTGVTSNYTGISTSTRGGTGDGGDILLEVDRLAILGGSAIRTGTRAGRSGNIVIRGETLLMQGEDADGVVAQLYTGSETGSRGNVGDIQITAQKVSVLDGAYMYTNTFGAGKAGNIQITANDVEFAGGDRSGRSTASAQTSVFRGATGQGGQLTINADRLRLAQGAQLNSSTIGIGNAGDITLNVRDIELSGVVSRGDFGTGIYALSGVSRNSAGQLVRAAGNGGVINIRADQLRVLDGAEISNYLNGDGNAGDINVTAKNVEIAGSRFSTARNGELPSALNANVGPGGAGRGGRINLVADQLRLAGGGQISSSTYSSGNGNNVKIQANTIDLFGTSPQGQLASGLFGNAAQGSGNGGNVQVTAGRLTIADGATINVGNFETRFANVPVGTGTAGSVVINADTLELRNRGSITTATFSGGGGNIILTLANLLQMGNQSLLNAEAGGQGNGGNITLSAPLILGFNNSDIIANAFLGSGGNIQITTDGIFGLNYRDQLTPDNDITASSQFGINGTVQINLLSLNPTNGLAQLGLDLVDSSNQISQGCAATEGNSFVVTGRSGAPGNPISYVQPQHPWFDSRSPMPNRSPIAQAPELPETNGDRPLKATSWRRNSDGKVELFANPTEPATTATGITCAIAP